MSKEMDALNPSNIITEKTTVDSSEKMKVGIIGTGWIAGTHAYELKQLPDAKIVAGADIVPGKAQAFFKERGVEGARAYQSHIEMLDKEELDAVIVCTYNTAHAVCTIDALDRGIPVLLEKPMCVTLDEAIAIVKAEKKSGKIVSVGFQPRFDPNMQMIKKIVDSGELGEIYYIQTGGGRRQGIPTPYGTSFIHKDTGGIGALGDIGCYSLDMVLNAVGYPKPLTVSGYKSDFFGKRPEFYTNKGKPAEYAEAFGVDDFAAAFVRLEGGIILDFRIAWAMNLDTSGDTILMGTKGSLRIPSTECWNGSVGGPMKIYKDVAGQGVETVVPVIENKQGLFRQKISSFLDAVRTGGQAPVPTSQIIFNQAILDGIVRSSEQNREIEINIPDVI